MLAEYGCTAVASKSCLIPSTRYSLSRKLQAVGLAYPGMPASTTFAPPSAAVIAACEIRTSFAYLRVLPLRGKNFDRLGSFQICQALIGTGAAPGCAVSYGPLQYAPAGP